jgi:hypothetical protein
MVVQPLLRPVWKMVADVFTSFLHGPAKDIEHTDTAIKGLSTWDTATDAAVDLSRCEEHHRMTFP